MSVSQGITCEHTGKPAIRSPGYAPWGDSLALSSRPHSMRLRPSWAAGWTQGLSVPGTYVCSSGTSEEVGRGQPQLKSGYYTGKYWIWFISSINIHHRPLCWDSGLRTETRAVTLEFIHSLQNIYGETPILDAELTWQSSSSHSFMPVFTPRSLLSVCRAQSLSATDTPANLGGEKPYSLPTFPAV